MSEISSKELSVDLKTNIPDPLWLGVVVPAGIPFMGQIDLFKNALYLIKQYAKNALQK